MYRTNYCGEINESFLGKEIILCGWVDARRDHGNIIFIDLRDIHGKIQVVFTPKPYPQTYKEAKTLRNEFVIQVKGEVNPRPEGTYNLKIPTGKVELFAKEIKILNPCDDLPFPIEDNIDVGEEARLYHRYLDLRRKSILNNFIVRHRFNHSFRSFLNKEGFLEIETPFLTKSTPEGARDFLVPSRINPSKFYALPQSPQLFKQILMVAGIDKYYQIVRCFRDEDLRKDRQPEFTQLDMELSFVEEEEIFNIIEKMFYTAFKEVLGVQLKIPFLRISYKEAMEKYSSDKPDIGEGDWRFLWIVDFPLFEYNEEEDRWQSQHHPFTAPKMEDLIFIDKAEKATNSNNLSSVRARAYDLVLNGVEIASGSIRIHTPSLQKRIFELIGISEEEAEKRFGFLLRAFKYGAPPHGGIAVGLDRLYAIINKRDTIRDLIAFPKTQRGLCPLTEAPAEVDGKQLEELGIEIKKEDITAS